MIMEDDYDEYFNLSDGDDVDYQITMEEEDRLLALSSDEENIIDSSWEKLLLLPSDHEKVRVRWTEYETPDPRKDLSCRCQKTCFEDSNNSLTNPQERYHPSLMDYGMNKKRDTNRKECSYVLNENMVDLNTRLQGKLNKIKSSMENNLRKINRESLQIKKEEKSFTGSQKESRNQIEKMKNVMQKIRCQTYNTKIDEYKEICKMYCAVKEINEINEFFGAGVFFKTEEEEQEPADNNNLLKKINSFYSR